MHDCWRITEIQHAIFRQVHDGHGQGKATLARLARTCRTFSSAALDVLWEELPSFACLIRCLRPDLWKIERTCRKMTFRRAMSLNDWEIFFRYSSRVRSVSAFLSYREQQCRELDRDVVLALSSPPHYGPLLPSLKTLCWTGPGSENSPLLPLLLTHSLVDITLPFLFLKSPTISKKLTSDCPLLKRLCVVDVREPLANISPDTQKILSSTILHLQLLESLQYHDVTLDKSAVVHLSRLPSLTELSLGLYNGFQPENIKPHLTSPPFASLKSLTLKANMLSTLMSFLEFVRFEPQKVAFTVEGISDLDELHQFFTALVNACDPEQLSWIYFSTEINWDDEGLPPDHEWCQISLSTFQPLFAFPNIRCFIFDTVYDISFDDNTIDKLTEHWPKLDGLFLNEIDGWGIESRVTHRGLLTLLSRCTELSRFALAVDFEGIDHPYDELPAHLPSNGVTSDCRFADFINSPIKHPIAIAAFLIDTCPALDKIVSHWCMNSEENEKKWEEVNDLYHTFRRRCN